MNKGQHFNLVETSDNTAGDFGTIELEKIELGPAADTRIDIQSKNNNSKENQISLSNEEEKKEEVVVIYNTLKEPILETLVIRENLINFN